MSSMNDVKDDHPSQIGPGTRPKRSLADKGRSFLRAFTTTDGLVGTPTRPKSIVYPMGIS
jgi:hypothetical protein